MRIFYVFIIGCLLACKRTPKDIKTDAVSDPNESVIDSTRMVHEKQTDSLPVTGYSNARFKDVTVKKVGKQKFQIEGKAQLFEANLGWAVEDGHNELKQGYQTTDVGAPEWGSFSFPIEVEKQRPNSTLILTLFETSAKDGSRQHELPIVLE